MMNKICTLLLVVISFHLLNAQKPDKISRGKKQSSSDKAIVFSTVADQKLNKLSTANAIADWKWKVNSTEQHRKAKELASKAYSDYARKIYVSALRYKWQDFKVVNATLHRWYELVTQGLLDADSSNVYAGSEDDGNPYSKMAGIFSKAKICTPKGDCDISADDIHKVFSATKKPKELKHYWLEFRKKTGEKYRDIFLQAIKKENDDIVRFGYRTKADYNIAMYEDKNFIKNVAEEMAKILPFYKQIHAYVRKKLKKHYKNENIKSNGPIPAHLLGNMYAQKWNVYPIVKPYPNSSGVPEVTKSMLKKKMKPIDMFIMAEKFFTSVGMKKMTPLFWHYSVIQKPVGHDVDCHAAAHDFADRKNFRIKMCAKVDTDDLEVVHHEMGHIEYFMHYSHLPFLFRNSANPGFHEAIGDAISLSVLTPSYMKQVNLLKGKKSGQDKESMINYLLSMALRYAVNTPYTYIIDHWRNQVYKNQIKSNELNKKYWEYRLAYQGVCPPSKRTENHFDIGSKFHIASGVEYFRYFVASILQFQIHKILCSQGDDSKPLHKCNIYKDKKAGKIFGEFLSQGRSRNWKELLHKFSRGKYKKLDASAMLEYFKPLMDWLKKKNAKEYIGWKSNDPMSCPGDTGGSETSAGVGIATSAGFGTATSAGVSTATDDEIELLTGETVSSSIKEETTALTGDVVTSTTGAEITSSTGDEATTLTGDTLTTGTA